MITDEMVEVACVAAADTIAAGYHARRDGPSKRCAEREMRAAIAAVLPMIRAEVLEEAAKVADARELRWLEDAEQSSSGSAERIFRRKADAAELIAFAIRAMKGTSHE